jgi:hypothetical protein
VIVAELEIYHSRPIAPTRRLALGMRNLPIDPAPGAGGVLLAGIIAHTARFVEAELREDLVRLVEDLDARRHVAQPRVRHRLQLDRVGLLRSTHRLVAHGNNLDFEFDDELGRPVQQALGALYAAGSLPLTARASVFEIIKNSLVWSGDVDSRFIAALMDGETGSLIDVQAWNDPVAWALEVLDLDAADPNKRAVQRKFRTLLRAAHPDHGGITDDAANRIAELTEARDILLSTS